MWFRNVYLKTLRDFRIAILGWGFGIGLLMFAVLSAVPQLVNTAAARASLVSLAQSFAWLAEPVSIGTPGGYATWKYGPTILVLAVWPLLVGSRMLRGEEERGSLDALLSLPRSRVQVALQKFAAMWTALLAMGLIIAVLVWLGGQTAKANFGFGGALLFGLNLILACGIFGSLALFLSQFTTERRTAAGIGGALLVISIVVDMLHRVIPNTEGISRLSPVYYYNLSKPLIPSYGTNAVAMLILVGFSVVLGGAAVALFATRDVGGVVKIPGLSQLPQRSIPPERALPANAWSLRSVYTRSLASLGWSTFWWTVIIAGLAAFMVLVVQQTEQKLAALYQGSTALQDFITKVGGHNAYTNATLLSALFAFIPLLLMAFVITGATSWSAEEEDGRLELVLATPQSRQQVILGRYAALATATVIIGVVTLAATELAAAAASINLNSGYVAGAALGMIPLGLLVAAVGYLFSGWLATAIDTGILSFLLVIWFVITFIGQSLSWPSAVLHLSALYYYGTPLINGLVVGDIIGILVVAAAALVGATLRFAGKDIGR